MSEVAVGTVIDANDEFGVVGLVIKGGSVPWKRRPARYRVIRWCDGEPGYINYGNNDPDWHDFPDATVGRGFWAVPLDEDGQECGPMRFFAMSTRLLVGDCRAVLPTLPERSVQCVVTSPPYFGLRDYGTAAWDGGDAACDHVQAKETRKAASGSSRLGVPADGGPRRISDDNAYFVEAKTQQYRDRCGKCGAIRIDRQMGLEPTVEAYVAELVAVFRAVWRVLRDDGCVWLNLGDSYATHRNDNDWLKSGATAKKGRFVPDGLKPKDLIGVPWRVALALQADGWYLRSDIIWNKPNPLPESVQDRPTRSHEYIFLLTKKARYFFDADAVREEATYGRRDWSHVNGNMRRAHSVHNVESKQGLPAATVSGANPTSGRNLRTVWTIATAPYAESHFATFPPALAERCIKAGTSERGACPACGTPWRRLTERVGGKSIAGPKSQMKRDMGLATAFSGYDDGSTAPTITTIGWAAGCTCDAGAPVPCVVLDPFAGAGTVALVADRLGRDSIGIELSATYAEQARKRVTGDAPLFAEVVVSASAVTAELTEGEQR